MRRERIFFFTCSQGWLRDLSTLKRFLIFTWSRLFIKSIAKRKDKIRHVDLGIWGKPNPWGGLEGSSIHRNTGWGFSASQGLSVTAILSVIHTRFLDVPSTCPRSEPALLRSQGRARAQCNRGSVSTCCRVSVSSSVKGGCWKDNTRKGLSSCLAHKCLILAIISKWLRKPITDWRAVSRQRHPSLVPGLVCEGAKATALPLRMELAWR